MTSVIILLLPMLFLVSCNNMPSETAVPSVMPIVTTQLAEEDQSIKVPIDTIQHIKADTRITDIIEHPAFSGFGQYIFSVKNRSSYDPEMRVENINSLLPYHRYINPDISVAVINRLFDDIKAGNTVFYDIYSNEQKQSDPMKEETGLFFFRGEPEAPFAIICAGGGGSYVGSIHESFPHAMELNKRGHNAFVLEYRVNGGSSIEDLAMAIAFIFNNADTLGVDTNHYSVWGSSAGARMAAYIGSYGTTVYIEDDIPRPAAVIIAYTGHTDYVQDDTPTFTMVSENDGIVNAAVVDQRVENLRNAGVDVEYEKYRTAGHGFGLGIGTDAEGWVDRAVLFWEKYIK